MLQFIPVSVTAETPEAFEKFGIFGSQTAHLFGSPYGYDALTVNGFTVSQAEATRPLTEAADLLPAEIMQGQRDSMARHPCADGVLSNEQRERRLVACAVGLKTLPLPPRGLTTTTCKKRQMLFVAADVAGAFGLGAEDTLSCIRAHLDVSDFTEDEMRAIVTEARKDGCLYPWDEEGIKLDKAAVEEAERAERAEKAREKSLAVAHGPNAKNLAELGVAGFAIFHRSMSNRRYDADVAISRKAALLDDPERFGVCIAYPWPLPNCVVLSERGMKMIEIVGDRDYVPNVEICKLHPSTGLFDVLQIRNAHVDKSAISEDRYLDLSTTKGKHNAACFEVWADAHLSKQLVGPNISQVPVSMGVRAMLLPPEYVIAKLAKIAREVWYRDYERKTEDFDRIEKERAENARVPVYETVIDKYGRKRRQESWTTDVPLTWEQVHPVPPGWDLAALANVARDVIAGRIALCSPGESVEEPPPATFDRLVKGTDADPWKPAIQTLVSGKNVVRSDEIVEHLKRSNLLEADAAVSPTGHGRIHAAMKLAGFEKTNKTIDGRQVKAFVRNT